MFDIKSKYGDRYKMVKDACLDYQIVTRMKARGGSDLPMSVWAFDDTHLDAYVPSMWHANRIATHHPDVEIVGDCAECAILRFPADILPKLAKALKLVRKRRMTGKALEKARNNLKKVRERLGG